MDKTVNAWLERQTADDKAPVIALDGKTLKASASKGKQQVHLLSAFLHHQDVVIAQVQVDAMRHEIVSGITSLTPEKAGPERLLKINRQHWGIENKLHYIRDITYDEDRCRIRTKSGPRVMAALRNLSIGILRLQKHVSIAKAVRHYAAKQHLTLSLIGI